MMELVQSLRRVCSHLDDVRGIALVGMDGLVVEELKPDPLVDLSVLAAELSVTLKSLQEGAVAGGLGQLESIQLGASEGIIIVSGIGSEYFLLLVLAPGGNPGRGRFYLQMEAGRLVSEF
ncbi:MAG: roadblock/LC7 domain-containing protein [Leptospirillia bacterium]